MMTQPLTPLTLAGSPGSPYTRKMLAVLRYRRIPYRLLVGQEHRARMPPAKVPLLPTFYLPDAQGQLVAVTDSTPLIRRLESEPPGRAVIPESAALAWLDALIEDYADEWLTKAMFHYRWTYAPDIAKASAVLPNWFGDPLDDSALAAMGQTFADRQIARLRYVGSHAVTAPTIEQSYLRLLDILERHFAVHRFVLGARPGAGDFGLYGQLTQLVAFDPTPMAIASQRAPRVVAWVHAMEDLSGCEPAATDWCAPDELPSTTRELLMEIGRVHVPLLLANADALARGDERVRAVIDGRPWEQQPFPYQGKCLAWLRRDHAALSEADRALVARALAGTGCEALLS